MIILILYQNKYLTKIFYTIILKIVKEIGEDLIEISENIEKLFIKLDTSIIQDEKYLIDSLVIEAKKEGLLQEKCEENEIINNDITLNLNNSSNSSIKKESNINNKINMSKIYENNNRYEKEEKSFPYDYNKNKAYYESLKNKNIQKQNDIFNSNEKNYFINNNKINNKRNINNINNNLSNFSFKNNLNISNNLLLSTDTSGPFRYIRKNREEPDLLELLNIK